MRRLQLVFFFCLVSLLAPLAANASPLPSTFYFRLTGDAIPGVVTFQIDSHQEDEGSGTLMGGAFSYNNSYETDIAIDGTVLGTAGFLPGTLVDGQASTPALVLIGPGVLEFFTGLSSIGDFYYTGNSYVAFELGSYALTDGEGNQTLEVADTPFVAATPEPSSLVLLGTGVVGTVGAFRRRLVRA